MAMHQDSEFDEPISEAAPPPHLVERLTQVHSMLQRVVLKVVTRAQPTPNKINGIAFDKHPPEESPEEIADLLTRIALSDYEDRERPPTTYEAVFEIKKQGGKKGKKFARFRVIPHGESEEERPESEYETIMRASLTLVETMQSQNAELHRTLVDNSKVLREATMPMHEAMKKMGEIVANAFAQTMYAGWVVLQSQREDRELELQHERWVEGADLLKEVLPKAFGDRLERLIGKARKKDESKKSSDSSEETSGADKDEKDNEWEGEEAVSLAGACKAFGTMIEPAQWAKLRKKLSETDLEIFERAVAVEDGEDELASELIEKLEQSLDNEKSKRELRRIFSLEQLRELGMIMALAKQVRERRN